MRVTRRPADKASGCRMLFLQGQPRPGAAAGEIRVPKLWCSSCSYECRLQNTRGSDVSEVPVRLQ